jgi:hypothetical protein
MDGTKTTTNWIIAGLVALVVIIGGGWLIARERSGTMAGRECDFDGATSTEKLRTGKYIRHRRAKTTADVQIRQFSVFRRNCLGRLIRRREQALSLQMCR